MGQVAFPGYAASVIYTVESAGALATAASGPSLKLYKNGSLVDTTSGSPTVALTTTTIETGVYRVSFTMPSGWAANDVVELFAATGSTGSAVVGRWNLLPASLLNLPSFPSNFAALGISVSGAISNVTTVNGLAANVITESSIAADAITDAKVASDVTIASVTGSVGSVSAGVTLAATTHTGATIPTVTTVTNLTNAPTSGDLTATMKESVATAVWSARTRTLSEFGFNVGLTSAYDAAKSAASQTSVNAIATDAAAAALWSKRGAAVLVGTISTAGTSVEVYTLDGVTVTATVDSSGNRSSVVFS